MRTVNVHEAKTGFSGLLADIEQRGERIVICRNGKPVADLVPHHPVDRSQPDPELGKLKINFDPAEPLSEDEWPVEPQ